VARGTPSRDGEAETYHSRMRRLCGRPGCSAPATVTFAFDATRRVVWLNAIAEGTARAGDLCTRHADSLVPPQGWTRDDQRPDPLAPRPVEAAQTAITNTDELLPHREIKRRRKTKARWSDVPSLFDETPGAAPEPVLTIAPDRHDAAATEPIAEPDVEPVVAPLIEPGWEPRFDVDDLGGLLDAKTPLLSRAFRAAKTADDDPDHGDDHRERDADERGGPAG